MKIQVERSGGFAGMRLKVAVDTDLLAPQEKRDVEALAETARRSQISSANPGADRFQYRITIEDQGATETIETGEAGMPEPLQAFVQKVILLGRSSSK